MEMEEFTMGRTIDFSDKIKVCGLMAVLTVVLCLCFKTNVFAENIITVGYSGNYRTIAEAVAVAPEGTTIFVQNGVYNEAVKVNKMISIVGESRDGVVLQYPCTYYALPPLEAQCGVFKNMTIKATPDTTGLPGVRAYAVHCEKAYNILGPAISFENCMFESSGNWDVGMGSCNGFNATFTNCVFGNLGMFYHTFGSYIGAPISATLNINSCSFAPSALVTIRNCFAHSSVLKVNTSGTNFPAGGGLIVISSADAVGSPITDPNFMFNAKNVIWNQY